MAEQKKNNTNNNFLATAKKRFNTSYAAERDNRSAARKSLEYALGNQWTDEERRQREKDGKVVMVSNKLGKIVKRIVGDMRQNMPRCKTVPARLEAYNGAEIIDEIIRNIERVSDAEDVYQDGAEQAVNSGYGYWRIVTDYENDNVAIDDSVSGSVFDQQILLKRIPNKFTVYFDQTAEKYTYADAQYAFLSEVISLEEYKARYPGKPIPKQDMFSSAGDADEKWFLDKQVRLAEYFYKKRVTKKVGLFKNNITGDMFERELNSELNRGALEDSGYELVKQRKIKTHKVMWSMISGSDIVEAPREFPSKYIPIVPILGNEANLDGKRIFHSAIQAGLDPQKAYNYILSKDIERIALSPNTPYLVTPTMIKKNPQQWANLHKKNYPYVIFEPDPQVGGPIKIQPIQASSGTIQHLAIAENDIREGTGASQAFFGEKSNERTGVAISKRSLAASTTVFTFASNFLKSIIYTGKILIDMIPRIYDTDRAVRIMGEKGNLYDLFINRTVADINTLELVTINDLHHGEYDYVATAGISFMTKLQELRAEIREIIAIAPQYAGILLPMFIDMGEFPDKDKITAAINAETQRIAQLQEQEAAA
jgi:hypothetical protein